MHHEPDTDWRVVAGSTTATVAVMGMLVLGVWMTGSKTSDAAEPERIAFAPGQLMALGSDADAPVGGQLGTIEPTPPSAAASADDPTPPSVPTSDAQLTDDATPAVSSPTDEPVEPVEPTVSATKPSPIKPSPIKPRPTGTSGSPKPNLPVLPQPGDGPGTGGKPTGEPSGFSDQVRDGDAWATDVLRALSGASVGTYGKAVPPGTLRFSLSVCADGRIDRVRRKANSTVDRDDGDRILLALSQITVPRPPPAVRATMGRDCKRLDYTFAWTARGVK